MYCENCGNYLELDDKYCPRCGNKNPHYIKRKNNQIEDIAQQSVVIKEEETKKKSKHINIRSIVVCLVLAIITAVLIIGFRVKVTFDGDVSIYMHEKVVEKSLQENVVTMTKISQYYRMGRLYLEEDVYAFDKSRGLYYHQNSLYSDDNIYPYVSFVYLDEHDGKANGKLYEYHGYVDVDKTYDVKGDYVFDHDSYNEEYFVSRVQDVMSAPGKGCTNTCRGKAFSGDYHFAFKWASDNIDTVDTTDFKVDIINWFGDEYRFKYSFIDKTFFTLR